MRSGSSKDWLPPIREFRLALMQGDQKNVQRNLGDLQRGKYDRRTSRRAGASSSLTTNRAL